MKRIILLTTLILSLTILKAQNLDPWTEYASPTNFHKLLSTYSGSFNLEITMYQEEGKAPVMDKAESYQSMLLGERFLEMKQFGTMLKMDFLAITTIGFNNSDQKITLTSINNLSTGTLTLTGNWDEKANSATLFGQQTNPVTKKVIKVKQVITFVDANTILIESFDQDSKKPFSKTMQYKYTRNKK
jgi:hypothetical protein